MTDVNLAEVQFALDRAHRVAWRTQKPDGSWDCNGQVGAWVTAQVVTVLRYLKVLDDADTKAAATWLSTQQRSDGSFAIHAYSKHGDLGTTAAGWAALQTWYEAIVQTTPAAGTYWPISPPEATGEVIIDGGAKATRYTVTMTQALVR